jgi:Ca-activated chloride channel family protein
MDEMLEAKIFSEELDRRLAGVPAPADLDPELAKDIAFAVSLDAPVAVDEEKKAALKDRLLGRAAHGFLPKAWNAVRARPVLSAVASCAVLVLALYPVTEHFMLRPNSSGHNGSTAGMRGGLFGSGASPYEPDKTGMAPGGLGASLQPVDKSAANNHGARAFRKLMPSSNLSRGLAKGGNSGSLESLKNKAASQGSDFNRAGNAQSSLEAAATRDMSANQKLGQVSGTLDARSPGESLEFLRQKEEVYREVGRDSHQTFTENEFVRAAEEPLSTFSIDVDAASYAQIRRALNEHRMPAPGAVRVEEMINYFKYDYPEPAGEHPFTVTADQTSCPWNDAHRLVRVGLKGKSIIKKHLPPSNLVFLLDTSGSMQGADRLELVKAGMKLLINQMRPQDRVAIVAYAGSAGLVLPSTSGDRRGDIERAVNNLQAGGSTAGGEGLQLAYKVAQANFLKEGNNRVILATDGDFNVGVSDDASLVKLIEEKRKSKIFLTILGVGQGNLQDGKMLQLADKGNGNYAYLDDLIEAQRVLVKEMGGTLVAIAKDVKIQVEFNPARVQAYRLVGYEKRMLVKHDFNDDAKDAGELGAGHSVTALYEVVPAGISSNAARAVDPLKYAKVLVSGDADSSELLTVKVRYKQPTGDVSKLLSRPLNDRPMSWNEAPTDLRFAASAAGFGMLLRGSKQAGSLTYDKVAAMARESIGRDADGYRSEMISLVEKAKFLAGPPEPIMRKR